MPCGTVTAKENNVVRILLRQVAQEEIHANCITVWHDQEAALPGGGLDSPVDITILPDVMTGDRRASPFRTPAEFGLVNPPNIHVCAAAYHPSRAGNDVLRYCVPEYKE